MNWLDLSKEQRRSSINQAVLTFAGITEKAIEKNWWVTLVLRRLFSFEHKDHILFKVGTSLSKCFGLIGRFSEDIDLVWKRVLVCIFTSKKITVVKVTQTTLLLHSFTKDAIYNDG